jgi:hypothetical protein
MAVESSSGATLGRVQEIIVDGYGRPGFAIVSSGGLAGIGTHYTAIPWTMVAEVLNRDRLVLDRSTLENAPVLASAGADGRRGEWRLDAERYWSSQIALAR